MKRILALLLALALAAAFVGCGKEEETTVTGMVASIDGTVISLVEMDGNMGGKDFGNGERPSMPENMEGFEGGEFDGNFPQWGEGEMPEFAEGEMPEFAEGEMPGRPEGGQMPEMPTGEDGQFQWGEGEMPDFSNFEFDGETTQIDIGNAHISVEIDGGKAGGSLEDITVGSFVTVTKNSKGEVTNVLVSSSSGFGGFGGMGGFGGRGSKPTEESET